MVDAKLPFLLNILRKQSLGVFPLTSRKIASDTNKTIYEGFQKLGLYFNNLNDILQPSMSSQLLYDKTGIASYEVTYDHGHILFAHKKNKGECILEIIKNSKVTVKNVILIDNSLSKVMDACQYIENMKQNDTIYNISLYGYHFTQAQQLEANPLEMQNAVEMYMKQPMQQM